MHSPPERPGATFPEVAAAIASFALFLAFLVPATARVRAVSMTDESIANLETFVFAHAAYAAEWSGRQYTNIVDEISEYGDSASEAFGNFHAANGGCSIGTDPGCHPPVLLGWCEGQLWGYWMPWPGNFQVVEPLHWSNGFGNFRIPNAKPLHDYVDGRFYSPTYYAPADTAVYATVSPFFAEPCEFFPAGSGAVYWSSYCLSPAAMFDPAVMRAPSEGGWQNPWSLDDGLTSPPVAAVVHPALKTRMIEHNWVGAPADCNPANPSGSYFGCEPYYFTNGITATPVAMFFDGHVRVLPNTEVQLADQAVLAQTGIDGLWSRDTPLGEDGYFLDIAFDPIVNVSHHVLTTRGIEGRDTLGAGVFPPVHPGPTTARPARRPGSVDEWEEP